MEQQEVLWRLYDSERNFIQHHENQRSMASNIMTAIAAGLIVASGSAQLDVRVQIAIAIMLMVIGLFGYLFCGKLTALIKLHGTRSHEYLMMMDALSPQPVVHDVKKRADAENRRLFRHFGRAHLHRIWSFFHLFIFLVGLAFLIIRAMALWGWLLSALH